MRAIIHIRIFLAVLGAWLLLIPNSNGDTTSRLSTRFLARGEQALLEVAVTGAQPTAFPVIPSVKSMEIRQTPQGAQTKLLPGRKMEYVFEYLVSSYEIGPHVVPPFEVNIGGVKTFTEPLEFTVFDPDELQWSEGVAGGTKFRYASAFRILDQRPYDGGTTPIEIKVFVPRDLFVEDWGIPDAQRDGVTAWRFQPSNMRGQVNLLGMPYISVAYPSTLTPTRTGKIGIGPATIRLITTQVVMDGILRRVSQEVNLAVPKLELESVPLPKGAPEGFENAIGNFTLDVTTPLTTPQEGDPIPVDIIVRGSGNLDTLRPPKSLETAGWKIYEPTTEQRGDERRELAGRTVFHQFMRPLELKPALPSFRLVYFDPKDATYKTLTSEPIPLNMTPAAASVQSLAPPQALPLPIERMTDILGVLNVAQLTEKRNFPLPGWLGHAIAGCIALGLIVKALWMRHSYRFRKDPVREARLMELREIERMKNSDPSGFLLSAGRFIERWLAGNPSPEVQAVLAERDAVCFKEEKPDKSTLEPRRRDAILKLLRKSAMMWLVIAGMNFGIGQARADDLADQAMKAYTSADYGQAISLWLSGGRYEDLTADTLYNIGNACYRAGSPGQAALYYRRSLARDPSHAESRQNLRFIERTYGSITVLRPEYQYALARFPLTTWKNLLWTCLWLAGLAALVFPATRPGARSRLFAVGALVVAPLLAAAGGLGWKYFPDDAEFATVERQAVIVADQAILHTEASRTSPEVINAPPGSLCEVLRHSGRWSYVAFASKTRGWIPSESIEMVLPATPPAPPAIRKPKADGKSA